MLFNNGNEIELDIKHKISNYIKNTDNIDINYLSSLIRVYLHELRIIKEVDGFFISEIIDNTFFISYIKNSEPFKLNISLLLEMRNIKIEKIKSNQVVNTFFI